MSITAANVHRSQPFLAPPASAAPTLGSSPQDSLDTAHWPRVQSTAVSLPSSTPVAPALSGGKPSALLVNAHLRLETWGSHTQKVWWTHTVKEQEAITRPGLMTVDATEIFRPGSVVFGFGLPNVYMAVVRDRSATKVDAQSLYRGQTKLVENHGKVQSGFFIVPRNLPQEAMEAVVKAAQAAEGSRNVTCVATNTRILAEAGFTINGKSPRTILPPELLGKALTGTLEFRGQPVPFDVVRTTPLALGKFIGQVQAALRNTGCRHLSYCLDSAQAKQARIQRASQHAEVPPVSPEVSPTSASPGTEHQISFSVPSRLGTLMRYVWGAHPIINIHFAASLNVGDYLPQTLKAFDIANPSLLTRVKRDVIFCTPVQSFLRHGLAKISTAPQSFVDSDAPGMINTNEMHNVVLTRTGLKFMSNKVSLSAVDWLLSKHVLVAGKNADVRFAGEMWKTPDNVIHINRNSGTYRPSAAQLEQAVQLAQGLFPSLRIQAEELPA